MKKIILICLCVVLLVLSAISVMAAADIAITLKADKQILMPGDQITIFMEVQTEKECTSFGVKMIYDENIFEVVEGSCKFSGAFISNFNPQRGFAALYLTGGKPKGEVGKVTLRVRESAVSGEVTFTGKTSIKDGDTSLQGTINTLTFQIAGEEIQQTQPQETQPKETYQPLPEVSLPTQSQETQPRPQETQPQPQETQSQETQPQLQETQPQLQETQPQLQQTQPQWQETQPQLQETQQQSQETQSKPSATEQTQTTQTVETQGQTQLTESTKETSVLEGTMPSGIYTIGADTQDEDDILLIAVIAVAVVATVAVGGYLVLKKKNK